MMRLQNDISRSAARLARVLVVLGVLVSWSSMAVAGDVSTTYFRIDVTDGVASESWEILSAEVPYDPGTQTWDWSSVGEMPLGELAVLNQANLRIIGDPQIAMGFAMTAGAADIDVTITTAVLSFDSLVDPDGAVSAGLTLTETDGDTATLTGLGGDNGSSFVALYNTPPGTIFAEYLPSLGVSEAYGSTSESDGTGGWVPMSGSVDNMQAQFNFSLSANDQASGTGNYLVIPEPAGLMLLAVSGLWLARRRS